MSTPSLFDLHPPFDGDTFDEAQDGPRTRRYLQRVLDLLSDGRPRTAREIAAAVGCSEAAAGSRARDLRKLKFGAYDVPCERVSGGEWKYRLVTGGQ